MEPSTTPHLDSATMQQATLNQEFLQQASLDHSTLNHQPGTGGDIPSLNVQSTAEIKDKNPFSPVNSANSAHPTNSANSANPLKSTNSTVDSPTATGVRQRVNNIGSQLEHATEHPAVKNAKDVAGKQVNQFREFLGNFPAVKELEKRFNVDRVVLVVGGLFAYILLVPVNLLRLALPITQCLTYVPAALLALEALDRGNSSMDQENVKLLLSYFVVLGLIQFTESLIPGVLEKRIPQYWTVKLAFLAYLIHPQTKGALKIHQSVLRNFVRRQSPTSQTQTPPQTHTSASSYASSPVVPSTNFNAAGTTIPAQNLNAAPVPNF